MGVGKSIMVIIPHASRQRPPEIRREWLSKNQRYLLYSETSETDRYSQLLYHFDDIINCRELVFPYSQIYLNICRDPNKIDEICPLTIRGRDVYSDRRPMEMHFRKKWSCDTPIHSIAKFHHTLAN